ncbi:MAG: gliding motility-associated C-terminal domain-containing protein [Bacteroidetes bacterium]|nr:gliding motility-associated C-terminal domain-containing protein [Bacteroidota bacterium]
MNRNFYKILFIFSLVISTGKNFYSQNPAACNNLVNLCTNSAFSFSANSGTGLTPGLNISNPFTNPQAVNAGCMFTNVANPQWLLLNITTSGNLGFSFGAFASAFPQAGNYDWIMWPYSPTACNDIFNNLLPPVACNFNCTGGGGTGMGTVPAGGSACNFQPSISVVQGQQYIILITNPSGVNTPVSFANTGSAGVSCNPIIYDNQTACPGQLAVFTGTWVNSTSGTYTLYPGAVVQTNPSFTVSSLTTQVYTVQAQGTNLSAVAIADQTTFTLTINPLIPISITTPTNFCYGSNATFTVSPAGTGTFNVTGPSAPTTSFATTSIAYPNVTTPNIGTFTVAASYTNGCTGTQTTQVNVSPNHTITVSSNTNVCMNGTVNLTSSMPTATAYAWTGPNGFNTATQNPVLNTIQPVESGVYTVTSNINFNGITCPRTNTVQVSVVATNPVTVTPSFTLCQGANLNLTASATGAVSYTWNGPGAYTSAIQNPIVAGILPAGAGNYTAIAYFTNGSLTCTTGAVSNVSVVATSTVAITFPTDICQNATANMTATATGALSYDWTGPNGFLSNISTPTIPNIQTNGSGVYTATALFAIGTVSCLTSSTASISVVGTNTIAVTPNFTLCQGANLNLTASAAGAVSYSWAGPGGYNSALQNPTRTAITQSEAGNYTVTASFSNSALTCTTGAVSNVSVVATSTVNIIVPANICQNATASMTVTSIGATGFDWAGPNAFTSTNATPNITNIQPAASGIYTATAMFSIGTVSCTTANTASISVVVTNTVLAATNFTICEGSNVNLTSSATGATSYSWNGPGAYTSAVQNPTLTSILPAAAGNYTATAFFTNGALTCTTAAVANVSVVATPTTIVTYPPNICQNTTANFTAAATSAISYAWAGPNGFASNIATPSIPNIQTNGSGVYTTTTMFSIGTVSCTTSNTNQVNVVGTNTVAVATNFTVCEGVNVNLTSNAASAVSYSWNGPGAYSSSLQNPTISGILPANAGNYTATAFFTNGSLTCTTAAVSNVSVVATPTLNVTVPANICQGSTANLTVTSPGAVSYAWVGPNSFASNLAAPSIVNIQPNGAGIYTATAIFSIGTVSCANTGTSQMNVVQINSITINSIMNGCAGQTNVLSANSVSAVGYSWTGPGGYAASTPNATLLNTPVSAAGVYTITTTYSNGFINCLNTGTLNLIVNPVVTFTLPVSTSLCYNSTLTIPGPSGASSYTWQNGGGIVSNAQNLVMTNVTLTQAGTYSLTATLGFCSTTQTILVNVASPIQFTMVPNSLSMCQGDSIKVYAGSTGGSANYAYVWNPPVFLSSPTGSIQTIIPAGTTIYNLYAYDIACPTYSITHTFTINVKMAPKPDLQLEKAEGCASLCQLYNAKLGSDAFSVMYDFGGNKQFNADSVYYCLDEPGVYPLTIHTKGVNGCSGNFKYYTDITVYPRPEANFYHVPEYPTLTDNHVTFYPTYGNPVASQTWMFSGTGVVGIDTTGKLTPDRYYEKTGSYPIALIATTDKGCADTILQILEVIDDISIYIPNTFTPNGDGMNELFRVQGVGFSTDDFIMELWTRGGNQIYFSRDYAKGWDGTVKGQQAEIGTYIYKIKVLGTHREGYKEFTGHVNLIR